MIGSKNAAIMNNRVANAILCSRIYTTRLSSLVKYLMVVIVRQAYLITPLKKIKYENIQSIIL